MTASAKQPSPHHHKASLNAIPTPIPVPAPMPDPDPASMLTKQDRLNILSRWMENARYIGGIPQAAVMYTRKEEGEVDFSSSSEVNFEIQIGNLTCVGSGLLIGYVFHRLLISRYKKISSRNPLYRNFKTLASFGALVGTSVAQILPLPPPGRNFVGAILADLSSIVFGLVAIPYWLIKEKIQKSSAVQKSKRHDITGIEGWSKYGKTFLVFGLSLGQVFGWIHSVTTGANLFASMAVMGGITSIVSFVAGIILVPVINKLFNGVLTSKENDKDAFRNNYVRSGMTFGVALGTALGFVVGTALCPGLGSMAGMSIGAAIGGVLGGISLGGLGKKISVAVQKYWKVSTDTDNSWDYSTRQSAYQFAFLGSAIGFFMPVPGGALLGAALGGAIGGVVGWFGGFGIMRAARSVCPQEKKASTLPWSQRVANGSGIGAFIGGGIGFLCGLIVGGPLGALAGAALGGAIGGFVGGVFGALYDRKARNLLVKFFFRSNKIKTAERELEEKEFELTSTPEIPNPAEIIAERKESQGFFLDPPPPQVPKPADNAAERKDSQDLSALDPPPQVPKPPVSAPPPDPEPKQFSNSYSSLLPVLAPTFSPELEPILPRSTPKEDILFSTEKSDSIHEQKGFALEGNGLPVGSYVEPVFPIITARQLPTLFAKTARRHEPSSNRFSAASTFSREPNSTIISCA